MTNRIYRCRDKTCGGLDCATCYGEQAARQYITEQQQEDCGHDEHDHGICLYCGKDISDDLQAAAENYADSKQDR